MLAAIAATVEPTSVSSLNLVPVFYGKDNFGEIRFLLSNSIGGNMLLSGFRVEIWPLTKSA